MTVDPSAAPVRERGVRSRAGNAMQRTRSALLDGAARAVEKHGTRRATMSDIAMLAGVAKGTLYNHFRTKEAVYSAAVEAGVRALAEECSAIAREDLADALATAAERIAGSAALRRVAAEEPATVAGLVTIGADGGWDVARDAVASVLRSAQARSDAAAVELVLRWLVTFVASPGVDVEAQACALASAVRASATDRAGIEGTSS